MADQSAKSDKPSQGSSEWWWPLGGREWWPQPPVPKDPPTPATEELFKVGKFNILVIGRSGAGKSTLINKIFEGDLAETGGSEPVTSKTKKYTRDDIPLSCYDTKGLEAKDYKSILKELLDFVRENQKKELSERIHAAWLCIVEDTRRVEDGEKEVIQELDHFMPVIGVINKARSDKDLSGTSFHSEVKRLLPQAKDVVRVRAIDSSGDDDGHGRDLDRLVEATANVLSDGETLRAFSIVQRRINLKKKEAHNAKFMAAISSAAAGAIPSPPISRGTLGSIQLGMLVYISTLFGIKVKSADFWSGLLSLLFRDSAKNIVIERLPRSSINIIKNIIKSIPAGVLATAIPLIMSYATLTYKLGDWYIELIIKYIDEHGDVPPSDVIKKAFKEFLGEIKKDKL